MKYHDMIIEKEYISKRGLFTPKCRSPPFLFSKSKTENLKRNKNVKVRSLESLAHQNIESQV